MHLYVKRNSPQQGSSVFMRFSGNEMQYIIDNLRRLCYNENKVRRGRGLSKITVN